MSNAKSYRQVILRSRHGLWVRHSHSLGKFMVPLCLAARALGSAIPVNFRFSLQRAVQANLCGSGLFACLKGSNL